MSKNLIILLIAPFLTIILVTILKALLGGSQKEKKPEFKYFKHTSPMTSNEQDLFRILVDILKDNYFVFPQIHISSIANHKIKGQNWQSALNHIDRKSVDFLICDRSLNSVLCIELDDMTHTRENRIKRDEEVENILKSIDMPLLRIESNNRKNREYIREKMRESMRESKKI